MPAPVIILIYGRDPQLLETRRMVLERTGYTVLTTNALAEIDHTAALHRIDLCILCYSLSMEECGRALALVHSRCPLVKSLVLTSGASGCSSTHLLDQVFDAMEGPAKLISTVNQLVTTPGSTHTQVY